MKYLIPLLALAVACVTADVKTTKASWYGEKYRGNMCADGKTRFDPDKMTCASWDYPFGTVLEVRYYKRKIRVTVTDRGPAMKHYRQGRKLDLSESAFAKLTGGNTDIGIIKVWITEMK
jgi:rare lipoprotein A (peptidoglycan hydrolase)